MNDVKGKILFFCLDEGTSEFLEKEISKANITVFKADNKEDAFNVIEKESPEIVLSRFSEHPGELIDFLRNLREKYPFISRPILCEESQQLKVMNLLIKGIVTVYFDKTAGLPALLKPILHIIEVREILKNKRLLKRMNAIERLPIFPTVYDEFLEALDNDASIKKTASIIEKDIALAAKVLQIANSAFYRTTRMGSVERACIYLGLETIKNIIFTASLSKVKELSTKEANYLDRVIRHSLKVNHHFQRFYRSETGKKVPDEFASVGLTHDIGKIIMIQFLPDRFKKIIRYQRKNPDISFYRSEIELGFEGCTHGEIGAYFLEMWNFPETNIMTALFHHAPETAAEKYAVLLDILELADQFAREV